MDRLEYTRLLAKELEKRFGDKIDMILLYGSTARGEARRESDIDLLIVGDKSIKKGVSRIRTEMDLEYGMLTTIIFKGRGEYEEQREYSDFLKEVARESVALYGAENIAGA